MEELNWFQTIIIAIVEGLTEFLPVSSTGHMIIAQQILGVPSSDFVKAFTVIIQFGAILSVVVLYWKRFFKLNPCKIFDPDAVSGKTGISRWAEYGKRFIYKYDFYWKLLIAFIPAAFFGLLFSDKIDEMLESVTVVAIMLVLGGIVMLFVDQMVQKDNSRPNNDVPKSFLYRLIPMYCHDTRGISFHGNYRRWYGTKIDS